MPNENDAWTFAMLALDAAERVLPLFEKRHPEDTRPRRCLDAARDLLRNDEKRAEAQQPLADAIAAYHAASKADSEYYTEDVRGVETNALMAVNAAVADRIADCCTSVYPSAMAVQAVISAAYSAFAATNGNLIAAACYAANGVRCAAYAPTYEAGRKAAIEAVLKADANDARAVAYLAAALAIKMAHSDERRWLVDRFTRRYAARWEAVQLVVGS